MQTNFRRVSFLAFSIIFLLSGCNYREREKALDKREATVNQKEQTLMLKEKELLLKEDALAEREKQLNDKPKVDSVATVNVNPNLTGTWGVKMVCTETSCPGSAVGDTKNEQWIITFEANQYLAKAMDGDKLVRVYNGIYTGNTLELIDDRTSTPSQPATKMVVRLRMSNPTAMEGQREIIREDNCKILYQMQLSKQ